MPGLLIRNGLVIHPYSRCRCDLYVEDGVIRAIGKGLDVPAEERIDASGKIVLPGAVDEHVHMREPGLEYKDNFTNGTRDALMGGVTTVLEMPNTLPPVDSATRLLEKKSILEKKAYVDFGLYGVIHDKNLSEVEPMINAGTIGFKIFLGPTTGNIPSPSTPVIYEALSITAQRRIPVAFHAEDWEMVRYFTEKVKASGRSDPAAHMYARPPICEELAIRKLAVLAGHTGARILIVHMASCEALEALREARDKGIEIYGETNPHYLLLDSSDYEKYGNFMKVNPPIREAIHRECLWRGILEGVITNIGSDHAPHSIEEKQRNVWSAPGGFPGVTTLLPLMLDQALRDKISLERLVELLSTNPAKLFNLYPKKGCLHPGCDADIVIVDPGGETIIDKEKMHTRNKYTPFHGWRLKARIEYVILGGRIAYANGEIIGGPSGRSLQPLL